MCDTHHDQGDALAPDHVQACMLPSTCHQMPSHASNLSSQSMVLNVLLPPPSPPGRAPIDAERPMTFKEFMIHGVGDEDVGPDAAQARYQEYLAAWWGDHIKAEFEQRKGDEQ